jgi:hypothetical protein
MAFYTCQLHELLSLSLLCFASLLCIFVDSYNLMFVLQDLGYDLCH